MSEVQPKDFLVKILMECDYQMVLPYLNGDMFEYDTNLELIKINGHWYPMAFFKVIIPEDELADYIWIDGNAHEIKTEGFDKIRFVKAGRRYTVKELNAKLPAQYKMW